MSLCQVFPPDTTAQEQVIFSSEYTEPWRLIKSSRAYRINLIFNPYLPKSYESHRYTHPFASGEAGD